MKYSPPNKLNRTQTHFNKHFYFTLTQNCLMLSLINFAINFLNHYKHMTYSTRCYYWHRIHINKINVHLTFIDARTRGWLLVDSPVPTIVLILLYLFLVWIGPKFMKNRKPYKLSWLLLPYNLAMACLNAYIAVEVSFVMCNNKMFSE